MADLYSFLNVPREDPAAEAPALRLRHSKEFIQPQAAATVVAQSSRCMGCGVPFCHQGCPLGNVIPVFNEQLSAGLWQEALQTLLQTNPFPEFTGRICPAPCETACVLGLHAKPVAIEAIEKSLAERGFAQGLIRAQPPRQRLATKIAVVGSGPAGLAAAWRLNRLGFAVTVWERDAEPGGLLMYGIPDFKLEKDIVRRRIALLQAEGVDFKCGFSLGKDLQLSALEAENDAVILALGATRARDLDIPGRALSGIHFAFDYLKGQTLRLQGEKPPAWQQISAAGRHVIVLGGGDTGSDCIGTAHRQGALSVRQFELQAKPNTAIQSTTSHEEGGERHWALRTESFVGDAAGRVKGVLTRSTEHAGVGSAPLQEWSADLVLLAIGYERANWTEILDVSLPLQPDGQLALEGYSLSGRERVMVAGDMRRGQSLVVWAIREGLEAARQVELLLKIKNKTPAALKSCYASAAAYSERMAEKSV